MEGLTFDNILGEQDIDTLFADPEDAAPNKEQDKQPPSGEEPPLKEKEETTTTEEVNPDDLFDDEPSESVGSEKKEGKEKEDTSTDEGAGTSPQQNFYSSIANALAVDGIFPNLTEEDVKKATDAETFSDLIEAEVNARLDDKQQRISKALDNGVAPNDIKKYEGTLNYINSITDAQLSAEGDQGEQLRRGIIYQDFLNKGYTPEKAQKFTMRTIDAGTDIEDAREALQSNKEYFQKAYNNLLQEAQERANEEKAERDKQAGKLKDSMLKDKQLMGDMELSNDVRKRAFEAVTKPVYRDPETGRYYTAIQKYEMEHRADFLKYAGLLYTLTDGFKDFDSFTKGKVKKEVRKGLRELEHTLNNTSRSPDGNLKMVTGVGEDPETYFKGMRLDLS